MITRDTISRIPKPAVSGSRDNEALQTDVMRFMAILGLCLTAIFSLLRSIPETSDKLTVQPAAILSEQQAQRLPERELASLPAPLELAPGTVPVSKTTPSRRKKEEQVHKQAVATAATEIPETPVQKPAATDHDRISARTKSDKNGFELRFASAGTLEKLARDNTIQLYALTNRDAWLFQPNRLPVRSSMPSEYYEMQSQTVPESYLNAMRITQPDIAHKTLTWAVTLPPATRQAITRLIANADGGELEIQADGNVTIK